MRSFVREVNRTTLLPTVTFKKNVGHVTLTDVFAICFRVVTERRDACLLRLLGKGKKIYPIYIFSHNDVLYAT